MGIYKKPHNSYTQGAKVGSRTENSGNSRTERRALTTCANVVILSMFKGYGWSDKSPVGFTRWNPQQPNSHHGQQPCVEMYSAGEWGDTGCYSVKQFVCKMPRCKLTDSVSVDKQTNKLIKKETLNTISTSKFAKESLLLQNHLNNKFSETWIKRTIYKADSVSRGHAGKSLHPTHSPSPSLR